MNEKDFDQALNDFYQQHYHSNHNYTPVELAALQDQFSFIVQNYLWEGAVHKHCNQEKYRKLSLRWHPDKLDIHEPFAAWYLKITGDKNILFKILNQVKSVYRPELKFSHTQNLNHQYYFFSNLRHYLPLVYNILWPFFYILEALEFNIDNYQTETYRKWARSIYVTASISPLIFIAGSFFAPELLQILVELIPNAFIVNTLLNSIAGFSFLFFSIYLGARALEALQIEERSQDLLILLLYDYPFKPVIESFRRLKNAIQSNAQQSEIPMALLGFITFSVLSLIQIPCTIAGLYFLLPTLPVLMLPPLLSLVVVNTPLMAYQCYQSPKASFELVQEYFLNIFKRYYSLAKMGLEHLYGWISPYVPSHWFTQPSQEPKPTTKDPKPEEKPVAAQPVTEIPYWQKKYDKLQNKDEQNIVQQKRALRKERNEVLASMGIDAYHPFLEKLDSLIADNSTLHDKNGFAVEDPTGKQSLILETLNLKVQTHYLKDAQQNKKYHSPTHLSSQFPCDLNHQSLAKKKIA